VVIAIGSIAGSALASSRPEQATLKPTIVLVHGGWAESSTTQAGWRSG
jgi:hypothetical protein